ncbi:MAG: carbamoyltransferase HypF [Microcystaceae cyanobacterium]
MTKKRLKITIKGAVQGVGFRPFIYCLATELSLTGWVNNTASGVTIEVEGNPSTLNLLIQRIKAEKPSAAYIQSLETQALNLYNYQSFEIRSSLDGDKNTIILPDLSTCNACLKELFDPQNRRYHYPFINCTHCGPRYSIIEALPYDRPNTTMKDFNLCESCKKEYHNPLDRRFHAQPNACPVCGPHLELWDREGNVLATHEDALNLTVEAIKMGKILAIKGLGGFHLMVDANNEMVVKLLRQRKHRPDKPFALMYPSLEKVKQDCYISPLEKDLLCSPQSPIVLLKKLDKTCLAASVAPRNPYLGIMLPYTPLHHLLLNALSIPLVATSGNLSNEPICIDEYEALKQLKGIADLFLVHNRPIVRPIDDSIARVINNQVILIRRGRGYAPFPITLKNNPPSPSILAVGGQLKNTVAILRQNNIFISQHIGDLGTEKAGEAFTEVMDSLSNLYEFKPDIIACDKHPNYYSTQYANSQPIQVFPVQHHYAHILAAMADNQVEAPVLGVAWDGTGYGDDRTIWGGEFIKINHINYQRVAYFDPFPLVGGNAAIKEPRRVALGLIYNIDPSLESLPKSILSAFTSQELKLLKTSLDRSFNAPLTSSVGRLFDGVSALLGCYQKVSFEGQAAIELEFALSEMDCDDSYPFTISDQGIIYWQIMIQEILKEIEQNIPISLISVKFHNTLVEIIIKIAQKIQLKQIILTGGCFQNAYLTQKALLKLQDKQFTPYIACNLPPNDGAIAVGQIMAVLRQLVNTTKSDESLV